MSQKLVPIVGVTDDTTGQLVGVKPDQSSGDITVLGQMSADAIADTLEDAKVSDPASLTRIQGLVSGAGNLLSSLREQAAYSVDQTIICLGDSTGNESTEWFYLMVSAIAERLGPTVNVRYQAYDDASGKYGGVATLSEGGGDPYVTVGSDNRGWGVPQLYVGALGGADLDVCVDVALNAYTGVSEQNLMAQFGTAPPNRAFRFYLNVSGFPILSWSGDGSAFTTAYATAAVPVAAGARVQLRAVLDVDNGSGVYAVTFYTSTAGYAGWTQLGSVITGGAVSSVYTATGQPVEIGSRGAFPGTITGGAVSPAIGRHYAPRLSRVIGGENLLPTHVRDFGEFNGMLGTRSAGASVIVMNGSIPGSNAAYIQTGDRLGRMLPNIASANIFINTGHNEGTSWDPVTFFANMTAYVTAIKARVQVPRLFVTTQNPQISPCTSAQIYGQMRRCQGWKPLALLVDATVIDTYKVFAGNESAMLSAVDGKHPTAAGSIAQAAEAIAVTCG